MQLTCQTDYPGHSTRLPSVTAMPADEFVASLHTFGGHDHLRPASGIGYQFLLSQLPVGMRSSRLGTPRNPSRMRSVAHPKVPRIRHLNVKREYRQSLARETRNGLNQVFESLETPRNQRLISMRESCLFAPT